MTGANHFGCQARKLKYISELFGLLKFPDFSFLDHSQIYPVALILAIIASLETLLSQEAVDKLGPLKRIAPTNRELKAQGVGDMITGLTGGLPRIFWFSKQSVIR